MFELLIKGGTLVTPTAQFQADVGVTGGKIVAVGTDLGAEAGQVVDAAGKLVLPGALDVHTHLAMPFGGTVSSDDYETGTRAAACGGVTTVFDYAKQTKGRGMVECLEERRRMAEDVACVDYAFHCIITNLNGGTILDEYPAAIEYGVTSVKCFMVYKKEGMMVNDGEIVQLLQRGKETGMLTNVHAENPDVIDLNIDKFLAEGKTSPWYHYLSRPEWVEAEADKRLIHWARSLNAPVYIVHLADWEGVAEVIRAKDEGVPVYAETCPQYLHFTSEVYKRPDGRNFVCSPPMKGQRSQDALWEALRNGFINTVATDHCPFQQAEKDWGKDDFTKIPNGCGGVEQIYPFMLSSALEGRVSLEKVVEVCCANPAHIFGCASKGSLDVGKDADVVLFDPAGHFTVTQSATHGACDHTIWEGTPLKGKLLQTYSRGRLVYDGGRFVGAPGWGTFLRRKCHG